MRRGKLGPYLRSRRVYLIGASVAFAFAGLWIAGIATPYSWIAFRGIFLVLVLIWIGDKRLQAEKWSYKFRWFHLIAVLLIALIAFDIVGRLSR